MGQGSGANQAVGSGERKVKARERRIEIRESREVRTTVLDNIAVIKQLVPMPDRWEFQYLFRDPYSGRKFERLPGLGLALVAFPIQSPSDRDTEQLIVHFGPSMMDDERFELYSPYGFESTRPLHPFFQNGPQTRGLGVAPIGSPDDWFNEDVAEGKEQLEAEHLHTRDIQNLFKTLERVNNRWALRETLRDGLDNYFAITSGKYRNDAGRKEWTKTFTALKKIQAENGDRAMIHTVLRAAEISVQQVQDLAFEV